jgi:energy-coupling factor transporter ATP-binding protein EcfA2
MKIESLILENYRGFQSLKLDLPQHCLLVGRNGSGKSTVVEAIALGLNTLVEPHLPVLPTGKRWVAGDEDIHGGESQLSYALRFPDGEVAGFHERGIDVRTLGNTTLTAGVLTAQVEGSIFLSLRSDRLTHPASPRPLELPSQIVATRLEALWGALGLDPATFGQVIPWFRREENAENETRLRRDPAYRHRSLEVVRNALTSFLNGLGTGAFANPHISRVHASGNPLAPATDGELVFDKDGQPLTIAQLSDGERTTLLMVADIARRLAIANPKDDPLQGPGIVLIDEVELHLHPAWQRAVLPALFATFPNIQFIATTHSPQVLASVPSDCVRILENFQAYPVGHTEGRDSNALLREIFDVPERPQPALDKLERVAALIDAEDFAAARAALAELRDALSAQDGEVVRLQSLLTFLEA